MFKLSWLTFSCPTVVITCPRLTAPVKGFFVKKSCGNVLNAACGVRCRVGYQLIGSSIRLCQDDGTWSGQEAKCIGKQTAFILHLHVYSHHA